MSTEQIIMGSALSMTHTQQAFFEQEDYLLPISDSDSDSEDEEGGRQSGRRVGLDESSNELVNKEKISNKEEMKEKSSGIVETLKEMGGKLSRRKARSYPIRVGFLSRYFFKHPVNISTYTPTLHSFYTPSTLHSFPTPYTLHSFPTRAS